MPGVSIIRNILNISVMAVLKPQRRQAEADRKAALLRLARAIVRDSTAPAAEDFNADRWLKRWLNVPQPALGFKKPSELLQTDEGFRAVMRVMGALVSGAYV